ncbi:nuclear transport factor 2 family protein [Streptomyces olivaceoviridis]
MEREDLPEVIRRYLTAHNAGDASASAALMTPDARVTDDGKTYDGLPAIERWLNRAASEYTYTTTCLGAAQDGPDRWTVTQRLDGKLPRQHDRPPLRLHARRWTDQQAGHRSLIPYPAAARTVGRGSDCGPRHGRGPQCAGRMPNSRGRDDTHGTDR